MMALASMRTNVDSTSLLAVTPLLFGSNPSGVRRDLNAISQKSFGDTFS